MKRWPLRVKIALWSALVVALALLISGFATALHIYHEDLELVDQLLQNELRGVFSELKRVPPDFDLQSQKLSRFLPAAFAHQHILIRHRGAVVYRSSKAGDTLAGDDLPAGNYTVGFAGKRLAVAQRGPWQVRVAFETQRTRTGVEELLRGYLLALPALLLVTAFGGWWIARQALSPIQAVTQAAQQMTAEHLNRRLPVPASRDEVQELSLVLNEMLERLERSFHQAQRFSADTSHELRTPLAVLHAGLEAMLAAPSLTATQEQQLLDLLDASTRLSTLSEKLLLLARADAGFLELDRTTFDLVALLREAVEEAAIFAEPSGIHIESHLPARLEIYADSSRLMQVLRNLLENAVKYNRPQGRIALEVAVPNGSLHIAVTNTGPGLEPDEAAKVFTRFHRAEAHRGSPGHGLGLSIAREIARAHGGSLTLTDAQPDHIEFVLTLPSHPAAEPKG